jgi:glycosyltransferase involved in cell wall biosynthesis
MEITFIIPVFNECETLAALAEGIEQHTKAPHRILFVDDGSTDGSWDAMCGLHERFATVDAIKVRRNFGKTHALRIGFERARGDVVVMMDADLQDDPAEIPRMLAKLDEGYDLVCGWKQRRHDPWHKTIPSLIYNTWVGWMFGVRLHDVNTGFKAMRIEVAKRLPMFDHMHRMIAVFAVKMGYRVVEIPVQHHPRVHGYSKYGLTRFYYGVKDAVQVWWGYRTGGENGFAARVDAEAALDTIELEVTH